MIEQSDRCGAVAADPAFPFAVEAKAGSRWPDLLSGVGR
jgi:hypothetical protein